jgi:hypothetical protein
VTVPGEDDEAIRDLCRARTDAVDAMRCARSQMNAFLLRHGHYSTGKAEWGDSAKGTLRNLGLRHPAMGVVLEDYTRTIDEAFARIARLEEAMEEHLEHWEQKPVVRALMGLRGFRTVAP